jgi:hypothetical protein
VAGRQQPGKRRCRRVNRQRIGATVRIVLYTETRRDRRDHIHIRTWKTRDWRDRRLGIEGARSIITGNRMDWKDSEQGIEETEGIEDRE